MAGSAFEWVADWYSATYYAVSPRDNPTGPESRKMHVIRGGWWEYTKGSYRAAKLKTTYRSTYRNETGAYGHLVTHGRDYYPGAGLRCAMGAG
jgi:formylglycine-generating enzyme required for sulfatase activity